MSPSRRISTRVRSFVATGAALTAVAVGLSGCGPRVPGTECPMFPGNNHWHAKVASAPVLTNSTNLVNTVGATKGLKADFGSGLWEGGPIGIPYVVVAPGQDKVDVDFEYDDESDPGPYPVPANPPIEGGPDSAGDRHILMVEPEECRLYELYSAYPDGDGTWSAGSGAIWDLRSNAQRPLGWTSADAAGLAILPGLVRYDEVAAGRIDHAIRMTVPQSRRAYLWPASHYASSSTDANRPAMGERFRLKASVDESTFPAQVRPILSASTPPVAGLTTPVMRAKPTGNPSILSDGSGLRPDTESGAGSVLASELTKPKRRSVLASVRTVFGLGMNPNRSR